MYLGNIVPEHLASFSSVFVVLSIYTHLSQVFHDNLLSGQFSSRISAIITFCEAMLCKSILITISTFPENYSWGHCNSGAKCSIDLHKVLEEIKGYVICTSVPDIIVYVVILSLMKCKLSQELQLGELCLVCCL